MKSKPIREAADREEMLDRFLGVLDGLDEALGIFWMDGRLAVCNQRFRETILVHEPHELAALTSDQAATFLFRAQIQASGVANVLSEWRTLDPQKREITFQSRDSRYYTFKERTMVGSLCLQLILDVTELKNAEADARHSAATIHGLIDQYPDPIFLMDTSGRFSLVNRRFAQLFNRSPADLVGLTAYNIVPKEEADPGAKQNMRVIANQAPDREERRLTLADGRVHRFQTTKFPIHGEDGTIIGVGGINANLNDYHNRRIAPLEKLAFYDPVTGLRRETALNEVLRHCSDTATLIALELSGLNRIASLVGAAKRDLLVRDLAQSLETMIKGKGQLFQLDHAIFAVLFPDIEYQEAISFTHALIAAGRQRRTIDWIPISLEAVAGIAHYPMHGHDGADLARAARAAIQMALDLPHSERYAVFDAKMDEEQLNRFSLVSDIKTAIDEDELDLHFQPVVDLANGYVVGAEALVRWTRSARGPVPAGVLVGAIEQTDLINDLTHWVMRRAIGQQAQWASQGIDIRVSINLSARNLLDRTLVRSFAELCRYFNVAPTSCVIEITETAAVTNAEVASAMLAELRETGASVALDDFGTGQSSLAYLADLPIDILKVDQTFALNAVKGEKNVKIIKAAADLGRELGLMVLVEGVEDQSAFDLIRPLGCGFAQGYYFGRPMPVADLVAHTKEVGWRSGAAPDGSNR